MKTLFSVFLVLLQTAASAALKLDCKVETGRGAFHFTVENPYSLILNGKNNASFTFLGQTEGHFTFQGVIPNSEFHDLVGYELTFDHALLKGPGTGKGSYRTEYFNAGDPSIPLTCQTAVIEAVSGTATRAFTTTK